MTLIELYVVFHKKHVNKEEYHLDSVKVLKKVDKLLEKHFGKECELITVDFAL